ncbi:MAG: Mur ligase family protein, partial [Anaerolineae bacterium]|nr:Mur ligase family protein [Anaerolineae bacterium]
MEFIAGQKIHFIGIGGFGISAIARILLERGFAISGSDRSANELTEALARDGAMVYLGHKPEHVHGADMVIRTSAVKDDHTEVLEANRLNIPVYKRQDILEALLKYHFVIAVAGTHGKTTTTAMITHILQAIGEDPSYIVGGIMANTGKNAGVGRGNTFVIEADEYDNMFWGLRPNIAILTNIEYDHPDFFATEEDMLNSFRVFLGRIDPKGMLIVCVDSPLAMKLAHESGRRMLTYSIYNDGARLRGKSIGVVDEQTQFVLTSIDGLYQPIRLPTTGIHNVQNAIAALLACEDNYFNLNRAISALATFKSTGRRFEIRGERDGIIVVDD